VPSGAAATADTSALLLLLILLLQGLAGASLAISQRQTSLLEASHGFNSAFINYGIGQLRLVMLPQLEVCVATTLQRMGLPGAQQQAACING
jgi:hypothetical protein